MLECRLTPAAFTWNPLGGSTDGHLVTNWVNEVTGIRLVAGQDTAPDADDDLYFRAITLVTSPPPPPTSPPPGGPSGPPVTSTNTGGGEGGPISPPASPPPPPASPPASPTTVSPNCILGTAGSSSPLSFAGIHVMSGYTGTLTLASLSTTVTSFEQHDGNIAQTSLSESQRNNLTVTDAFEWAGGVLNSTWDAGIVTLDGVAGATIGDETDNNYTLGSDLKLVSGTTLIASGSIVLNNDAGLVVGTGCSFDSPEGDEVPPSPPPPQPPGNPQPAGKKWVDLIAGLKGGTEGQRIDGIGMVLLEGDAAGFGRMDDPVWVTGGTLKVSKRDMDVTKKFTTRPNGGAVGEGWSPSVYVTSGTLIITEGRTLKCSNRVEIDNTGVLSTLIDAKAPAQIAKIDANLKVVGGTVELGKNPGVLLHQASTLQITGDVQFVGGIYKPQVRATLNTECDLWKADGTFTFVPAAKIDPVPYGVIQNPGPGVNGDGVGLSWQVIYAKAGFTDATKPTTSVAADWSIDKGAADVGDPIRWESIKVNRLR